MRVGLIGYGKAGRAVAGVLANDPRFELEWIATRSGGQPVADLGKRSVPMVALRKETLPEWFNEHPVDAVVDFSSAESVAMYADEVQRRGLMLVTAISSYDASQLARIRSLGEHIRVLCSPNITVGINFLIMAARLLKEIAPFADVEILEQHFREKPEISGTARKIAESLDLGGEKITSMRLGGIVGHHEVIFGFPYQTVRLIHNSIKREAFGTGAAFVLDELQHYPAGFYTFDDILMKRVRSQLLASSPD